MYLDLFIYLIEFLFFVKCYVSYGIRNYEKNIYIKVGVIFKEFIILWGK